MIKSRQADQILRLFHLLKQPLQRQLLPFQPAEIAAAVVAPTKKALQILTLQQLRSWLQVINRF